MPDKSRTIIEHGDDEEIDKAAIARDLTKVSDEMSRVAAELATERSAFTASADLAMVQRDVSKAAPN